MPLSTRQYFRREKKYRTRGQRRPSADSVYRFHMAQRSKLKGRAFGLTPNPEPASRITNPTYGQLPSNAADGGAGTQRRNYRTTDEVNPDICLEPGV
jgi:hypothetical protein